MRGLYIVTIDAEVAVVASSEHEAERIAYAHRGDAIVREDLWAETATRVPNGWSGDECPFGDDGTTTVNDWLGKGATE